MERKRLTDRALQAAESEPYPGMVGQPDRTFEPMDEYNSDAYKQEGWYYPDESDDWKNEERNEIGVGIPREDPERSGDSNPVVRKAHIQKIRQAASKAVRLAVLLLGDKSPEDVVEAQARDFMRLGSSGLDSALSRYAETANLYAEDEKPAEAKKAEDAEEKKEDEAKGEEEAAKTVQEEVEEEAKGEAKKAEDAEAKKSEDEEPAEAKKAEDAEEKSEDEEPAEAKKAEDEEPAEAKKSEDEKPAEAKKAGELDIELVALESDIDATPEQEALLASLYTDDSEARTAEDQDEGDDEEACVELKKSEGGSKKAGVQTLGGQPKVASASGDLDLTTLWKSAPDVSSVFGS